jgi:hypothetical protein
MKEMLSKTGAWIASAFSDNGTPSSSRILAAVHSLAATFVLIFVSVKTHAAPDGTVCGGLGAFATAPYFINKAGSAIESFSKKKDGD